MSRHLRSLCLGGALFLALTGTSLAQDSLPVIWMIQAHDRAIESVSFSADGQTIVTAAGAETRTWRALDGAPLQAYPDHIDGVISVDISPGGQYLAIGYIVSGYAPGGAMDLWDVPFKTILNTHGGSYVSFSPGGDIIASGGGGANRYAYRHRVTDGQELASYYNGPGYITDLAYSPDGQLLAVSNTQNEVTLWDTGTNTVARTLSGHTDDVSCIAFSGDGQLLAAGAGGFDLPSDSTIRIWRVADGELLQILPGHGSWTYTVAFHPSGQLLASSGRDSQTPYSASLRLWRLSDGAMVRQYDGLTRDIAFSPGGESFCFGRSDGMLVLVGSGLSAAGDEGRGPAAPVPVRLWQNYPNPFNPSTAIRFELAASSRVELQVYSAAGRRIASLVEGTMPAGRHEVTWSGRDEAGRPVASGIYFCRLRAEDFSETRSMLLIK
jgi:WD40 repeat protein